MANAIFPSSKRGLTPPKEEHREHEELIPPCETGRIINYAVLEEGDSTINYLSPQYDGGEHVPHVPYVPFMINFSPRCLTLTKKGVTFEGRFS